MKRKVLTDIELRSALAGIEGEEYRIPPDTMLTPAASDYAREHGVRLIDSSSCTPGRMSRSPVPMRDGKPLYRDAATGSSSSEKPEGMTHLRGNLLVAKTHPRIAFRGKLDSLTALILWIQADAEKAGESALVGDLGEFLRLVRSILGAEVKNKPLGEFTLMGMDSARLRYVSHHVDTEIGIPHPIPDYHSGSMNMALNYLRTQVRETELAAAMAFAGEETAEPGAGIIEALNRLSSAVYILFCRRLAGK